MSEKAQTVVLLGSGVQFLATESPTAIYHLMQKAMADGAMFVELTDATNGYPHITGVMHVEDVTPRANVRTADPASGLPLLRGA